MSDYITLVRSEKKFTGNVVIQIGAVYFAIRNPDSGLIIPSPRDKCVGSLTLNPTSIDIRKVNTTISSFSYKIIDKESVLTAMVAGDAAALVGQPVRIFLGRSGVDMPFANYYELPLTYLNKCTHKEDAYLISSTEQTERMAKPIYDYKSALGVDILAATTIWSMRDDISDFPTAGFLKVEDEFVSYAGLDLVNNRFTGVVRGELNSVPADHESLNDVVLVETITGNPLDLILQILISGGGGGAYDVLQDGLGISESLIDIAEIEELRDAIFIDYEFTLSLYNIDSALKFLENELLMPNGLRLTNSVNSKITLALLDKAVFVEENDVIDEDTISKYPSWEVDATKVTNIIEVQWDYSEALKQFRDRTVFEDAASIALYGRQTPLKFDFKGIKADLDGENLVNDFGQRLLARLSTPTPTVSINTQLDKSLQTIGDKAYLVSSKIPAADGTLNFASDLEIISRAINHTTGDVSFTLVFTSFTNIRSGFIAPSDLITSAVSQKKINVALGREELYKVGWFMRLWDDVADNYTADPPNEIVGMTSGESHLLTEGGDYLTMEDGSRILLEQTSTEGSIIFADNWATPLIPGRHRIRFAQYPDTNASQKRYAFISDGGANFADGKPSYKVTY